ncbi:MAG: hypothetical protein RLZZ56_272 [Actinomycetota bacterium]
MFIVKDHSALNGLKRVSHAPFQNLYLESRSIPENPARYGVVITWNSCLANRFLARNLSADEEIVDGFAHTFVRATISGVSLALEGDEETIG